MPPSISPSGIDFKPSLRFAFNGQEKTDEISGVGNHTTALYWEYDTRLGRRWNLDPKPNVEESRYLAFKDSPVQFSDPDGDVVPLITMGVGGVIGAAVGLYDLSGQHGGLLKAVGALSNGDGKAWAHLTVTTATGVALGSGVGIMGAMGIAGAADIVDQTIQHDFNVSQTNPIQTGSAILFAGAGSGAGKFISKSVLKPITQKGNALNIFAEKTTFPANTPITVATTEAAIGVGNSVAEKVTNYVMAPSIETNKSIPFVPTIPNSTSTIASSKKKK